MLILGWWRKCSAERRKDSSIPISKWGVSRTGYLIPGRVGLLAWPWPRILPPPSPWILEISRMEFGNHKFKHMGSSKSKFFFRASRMARIDPSRKCSMTCGFLAYNLYSRTEILKKGSKNQKRTGIRKIIYYSYIGVRGFLNGIFNPWVHWNTWPGLGREFFRRRRRRRRPPKMWENAKTKSLMNHT